MADPLRIAAVSDIHYNRQSKGKLEDLFRAATEQADVLLLCGDLTDYGLTEEAEILAQDLREYARLPIIGVLGNHDFESGTPGAVRKIMEQVGVTMLDGESTEVEGVGFAGVCGFAGGFDEYALNPWGEAAIKQFVQTTVDEALKLETALARIQAPHRVVLLHYAPIRTTVVGEPAEIFPFLGSSRLEDPLNHYHARVAFHGHAHKGAPEGETGSGIPVYNVSLPVLKANYPDAPPFRLFELAR